MFSFTIYAISGTKRLIFYTVTSRKLEGFLQLSHDTPYITDMNLDTRTQFGVYNKVSNLQGIRICKDTNFKSGKRDSVFCSRVLNAI